MLAALVPVVADDRVATWSDVRHMKAHFGSWLVDPRKDARPRTTPVPVATRDKETCDLVIPDHAVGDGAHDRHARPRRAAVRHDASARRPRPDRRQRASPTLAPRPDLAEDL